MYINITLLLLIHSQSISGLLRPIKNKDANKVANTINKILTGVRNPKIYKLARGRSFSVKIFTNIMKGKDKSRFNIKSVKSIYYRTFKL